MDTVRMNAHEGLGSAHALITKDGMDTGAAVFDHMIDDVLCGRAHWVVREQERAPYRLRGAIVAGTYDPDGVRWVHREPRKSGFGGDDEIDID